MSRLQLRRRMGGGGFTAGNVSVAFLEPPPNPIADVRSRPLEKETWGNQEKQKKTSTKEGKKIGDTPTQAPSRR